MSWILHRFDKNLKPANKCLQTSIDLTVISLIFLNSVVQLYTIINEWQPNPFHSHSLLNRLTTNYFQTFFALLDVCMLTIAVVRVWSILRKIRVVSLNERYMVMHIVMLLLLFVSEFYLFIISNVDLNNDWFVIWTTYHTLNFLSAATLAFVLWNIDSKHQKKWQNKDLEPLR